MIIEEDIYLEHFGVKGMHWGVRKSQNHPDVGNRKRSKRGGTPEQKRAGTKKLVRNVAVGLAVGAAGGIVVGHLVKNKMAMTQIKGAAKTLKGQKVSKGILKSSGNKKMSTVSPKLADRVNQARFKAGVGRPNQANLKTPGKKHLSSVTEANKMLKTWFNENNVPIKDRELIDTTYWERLTG